MPPENFGVRYEVAEDEGFRKIVRRGAVEATPELAHSAHPEIRGLRPGREYFYRFKAGPELSPVGRTKTAPAPNARLDRLAIAFASCQNYPSGYYTAYWHMAEEDLDLVFHLGDYIYEVRYNDRTGVVRQQAPDREVISLPDYRIRYAQYKTDADLQAAHSAFPWIVTLDDHEVDNNCASEFPEAASETPGREEFLARREAAFQAFYEHLPLRAAQRPMGPDIPLYRKLTYGNLAEFNVLDTRQYRDDQACGDGLRADCEDRLDPSRTMLGDAQERWLLGNLGNSPATWNVLAQQIMLAKLDYDPDPEVEPLAMDLWDGYEAARQRLLSGIVDRAVKNPVVLTGDIHRNMAANLQLDFDDPGSATIGAEFVGTSITSFGDGADQDPRGEDYLAANEHIKFHNVQRGYVSCTLTPDRWRADYRVLPYVTEPGAPVYTRASFTTEAGNPGLQQVDSEAVQGQRYTTFVEPPDFLESPQQKRWERRQQEQRTRRR